MISSGYQLEELLAYGEFSYGIPLNTSRTKAEQSITIFEPSEDHGDQTMMLMVVGNTLFIYYRIISPLIGPQKVDLVFPANYDQNEIANRTLERMSELFEGFD